jgi:glycosyltransferase involved in cell wall biosynthesis
MPEIGAKTAPQPAVSLVIPAYNAERYLPQAVESVIAERESGVKEILLVEDGSPDGTLAVARSLATRAPDLIRLLRHPGGENRGPGASRNLGIREARGEVVCFLDADDYWLPNRLEVPLSLLATDPETDGVYDLCLRQCEDPTKEGERETDSPLIGIEESIPDPGLLLQKMFAGAGIWMTNNILVRRSAFARVGMFNEALRLGQDTELWFRMAAVLRLRQSPQREPTTVYRRHPSNRADAAWMKTATPDAIWDFYRPQYESWDRWFARPEIPRATQRLFGKYYIRKLIWFKQHREARAVARRYGLPLWTLYQMARHGLREAILAPA